MTEDDTVELLVEKFRWLRLPGMAGVARALLEQSASDNLTVADVLHRLADEERQSRTRSAILRRIHDAKFPEINTVDGFSFDFSPCRKKIRSRYLALHDLSFLDQGINPLFIGSPGTGDGSAPIGRGQARMSAHEESSRDQGRSENSTEQLSPPARPSNCPSGPM